MAVGVDADGNQRVDVDDAVVRADFLSERIAPHEGVRTGVQQMVV